MTDAPVNTAPSATFFLVWTKTGRHPPRRSYPTAAQARIAATEMARRYPDQRWFVLQAVERLWVNEAPDRAPAEGLPS